MSIVDSIRLHYPLPIARLYAAVQREDDHYKQVRKSFVWFEGILAHLSLIGLAGYTHYQLFNEKIEAARRNLGRPSLGDWNAALTALTATLESNNLPLSGINPLQPRKNDKLLECTRVLARLLGQNDKFSTAKLPQFFTWMIRFRNEKLGHGELTEWEAKELAQPLIDALSQWLEELTLLQQCQMVYIKRVEFENEQFVYRGVNLNSGDSILPFLASGERGVQKERLYLRILPSSTLISLYPWFDFDNDRRILYSYSKLSSQDQLLLRCPYDEAAAEHQRIIDCGKTWIIGTSLSEQTFVTETNTQSEQSFVSEPTSKINVDSPTHSIRLGEQSPAVIEEPPLPVPPIAIAIQPVESNSGSNSAPTDTPTLPTEIQSTPFQRSATRRKSSVNKLSPLPTVEKSKTATFDDLTLQLIERVRQVCDRQARYPVLWLVGAPCTGKSKLAQTVCASEGWQYINFTLDTGWLDSLIGQEETCDPEDVLALVRSRVATTSTPIVVLDEIEPVLSWWSWDTQESFFSQMSKASRLPCGLVLVTRLRTVQQLAKHLPQKSHSFTMSEGVGL